MNHIIKVTLAEDGDALRRSLADSLREQPDISVLGVASEGGKLVALCREMPPDVVVVDIRMPVSYTHLITTSESTAAKVSEEIDGFLSSLSRSDTIRKSLDNYGYILIADSLDSAIDTANEIASEHLEILTKDPYSVMTKIRNAGAIFLGEYSSEPLGDYFAGPNHVLPTNGTAKFFSPLNVDDFMKKTSIIAYSREALEKVHKDIELFAEREGLTAHANSIKVRFE